MVYYHCSATSNIKILEPNITKNFGGEKVVYMTSLKAMALFYGINHFEYTYGYWFEGGKAKKIYYLEHFDNALEELYKGKKAYLYICEDGEYEKTKKPNEYISREAVKVLKEIEVNDVYDELISLEKEEKLEIIRFKDATEKMLKWIRKVEMDEILQRGLLDVEDDFSRYMKGKYPLSWVDALRYRDGSGNGD